MRIFGFLFRKRDEKRKLKERAAFAHCFATLDRLQESGMLSWNPQMRQLFIMQPLAVLMMKNAESWQNFIQNCYSWTHFNECQRAWDAYMQKEELAAVRAASVGNVTLSRDDVDRIRRARRAEIAESDMEPPKIEPFEFFIVQDTTDAAAKLIAVGYFNPETNDMELAPWSEVEPLLKKGGDN